MDRASSLTAYAWRFRYPGDTEEPSEDEIKMALALAREVHRVIAQRLPPEVRP
jgi:hypothetical protein